MRKITIILVSLFTVLTFGALVGYGQDTERSTFVRYVEEQISTPSYQIRLNGLEGTLSSDVSLQSITIADKEGIWLTIEQPRLVWSRTALVTGRLVINSLTADHIKFARKPIEDSSLPTPESTSFALPELPVAVVLQELKLPVVEFGPDVIDLASRVSIDGKVILDDGSLDLDLAINRLDGEGGTLRAISRYDGSAKFVDLDIQLTEPQNGVLASSMGLDGRPPVSLSIKGSAPVSELEVTVAFDVADQRVLGGMVKFAENAQGLGADVSFAGPISSVFPVGSRSFFGGDSKLQARALFKDNGEFVLQQASLESGVIDLKATAATTMDGFLSALKLNLTVSDSGSKTLKLPGKGGDMSLASAGLMLNYDALSNEAWTGSLRIEKFANSAISVNTVELAANGKVTGLQDATNRFLNFDASGSASGISSPDPAIADALGHTIQLAATGDWQSGEPVRLSSFQILGEALELLAVGEIAEGSFDGKIDLNAKNLSAFSAISDKNLRGAVELTSSGKILPLSGGFDVQISGAAMSLSIGNKQVDPLLVGLTTLSGGVARTQSGLAFNQFKLDNRQMQAKITGSLASETANLTMQTLIHDLNVLDENSTGKTDVSIDITGKNRPFDVRAELGIANGKLARQQVENIALVFEGTSDSNVISGNLSSSGLLGGQTFSVLGKIDATDQKVSLQDFSSRIGKTAIDGFFVRQDNGLMQSELNIKSSDISAIAALALTQASGAVNGSMTMKPEADGTQSAKFAFAASRAVIGEYKVADANIRGAANDLLTQPKIDATINAAGIQASGIEARSFTASIANQGTKTTFEAVSELATNLTRISTRGEVNQGAAETTVLLKTLEVDSSVTDARLRAPSSIVFRDETIRFDGLAFSIGKGAINLSGTAGDRLNVSASISAVPLSILNSFRSDLGAGGDLDGSATITGTADRPVVSFRMKGRSVTLEQIRSAGIGALAVSANGTYSNNIVRLEQANARNSQQLDLTGSGTVPLNGRGLKVAVQGTAPASIVEPLLADRGTRVAGIVQIAAEISGSVENPNATGSLSLSEGSIVDPGSNLKLVGVRLQIRMQNSSAADLSLNGNLASGGSVSARGSIGLTAGFPAQIEMALQSAKYTDGETFSTSVDGNLTVTGKLTDGALLTGNLDLGKTAITIPETLAAQSKLVDVEHVGQSANTSLTLARIERTKRKSKSAVGSSVLRLDVSINAANQIFLRGRGLDAELGGRVRLVGTIDNVFPEGRFVLRRGRLSILGQRLDLKEGSVTLAGDLDPKLDFLATTQSGDVLASIRIQGTASDVQVSFSSSPELPEDEILARIVFGRSISSLSPAQVIRLASVASELAGNGGSSIIDDIRNSTGLDDIDVVQDDEGNSAVKTGKYVTDNVYLGIQAGQASEATINLDITSTLKARGAVDSEGGSSLGVFFEKDY